MIRPTSPFLHHSLLAAALVTAAGCDIRDAPSRSVAARALDATAGGAGSPGATIAYVEGYEAGLRRSCEENRPLLVVFKAGWCPWCGRFAEGTLADPRVVALARHFVCTTVDADRHADDCRRFGVREFPTVIVSGAGGGDERRWTGCPTPEEFVAALEAALPEGRIAAEAGGRAAEIRR